MTVLFTVITVAALIIFNVVLKNKVPDIAAAIPMIKMIIGLIAYFLPLAVLMTFIWGFSNMVIIKEKVDGNIESLLATPMNPVEIWIGKSMAIFLPGYIISVLYTLIVLLSVNFIIIIPATGDIILPVQSLLLIFLINPLLFLALLLFIVLFSLADNPDIAITPAFIVGFGLMMGIPLGVATGTINLVSWSFALWYLGGAIIFWIVDLCLYRMLTKERIVLSSKGE